MTATEYVVLVDRENLEIGQAEKLTAHAENLLHRAFSVFVFRQNVKLQELELLLQQRATSKYHSPGLWTNTCCSHPRKDEDIVKAGERRLQEELGIIVPLQDLGWFHYNAYFENGLSENEIDHVLVGMVSKDIDILPNPAEVHDYQWLTIANLETALASHPEQFTPWLKQALEVVKANFVKQTRGFV